MSQPRLSVAQPFGRFLLTAAALGFVAFGVFAVLQSRYRRMPTGQSRRCGQIGGRVTCRLEQASGVRIGAAVCAADSAPAA